MILLTNGCSWTWGGGLSQYFTENDQINDEARLNLVWPHYLGKLINADKVVNLSMGCGSNQRIVRTTYDWLLNEYDKTTPVIAIIQWSELSRYEYYLAENICDFSNDPKKWALAKSGILLTIEKLDSNDAFKKSQSRLTTYTELEGMYQHIRDCTSLAYIFNQLNIKFYFWAHREYSSYPDPYKKFLKDLNYLNFDCSWTYDRISSTDLHPSLTGHKQLAEILYNEIKF